MSSVGDEIGRLVEAARQILEFSPAAFVGSLLVALACALVGVHVAARRLVVVGVALPQVAAFGIALSFVWAGHEGHSPLADHEFVAFLCEIGAVALLAWGARRRVASQDTLAGVLFVAAGGLTILLMMRSTQGIEEVRNLVEGNVLALHGADLGRLAVVLAPVFVVHGLGSRRLLACTFDPEGSAALGVRVGAWNAALYVTLALVVAAGVHSAGTLFVFGYLVIPGVAGILVGRSAAQVFATAVLVAVGGAAAGFVLSYRYDMSTGPMCTTTALALLLLAGGFALVRNRLASRSGRMSRGR